jgi:hypothetical protein
LSKSRKQGLVGGTNHNGVKFVPAVVEGIGKLKVTRVNSANVLDEGLRIGGRGCQVNSNVKIQTNKAKLGACSE